MVNFFNGWITVLLIVTTLLHGSQVAGQNEVDYDGDADADRDAQTREFMIPHPRLGRYMDYAVLKFLANYLKDTYTLNDIVQQEQAKLDNAPDVVLQRELRDMKGKGYGIPIPRVGKRSVDIGDELPPARPESGYEIRSLLAALMQNQLDQKRTQQPSIRSMFKPRVGRAGRSFSATKNKNWQPIPRVG